MKKIILFLLTIFLIGCAEPVLSPQAVIQEPEEVDEKEHDYKLSGFWQGEGLNLDREFVFMTGMGTGRYQTLGYIIGVPGQVFNYFFFHTEDGILYIEDMDTREKYIFEYSVEYYGHLDSRNILYMRRIDLEHFQTWNMIVY